MVEFAGVKKPGAAFRKHNGVGRLGVHSQLPQLQPVVTHAIAATVEQLGFDLLIGEGADRLLDGRSPQQLYRPAGCERLALMLRSYMFSDDIGFRFSNREWTHYPLFANTFANWLDDVPEHSAFVGMFMDYETFGEHQWTDTGIFEFMRHLPRHVLEIPRLHFRTPSEVATVELRNAKPPLVELPIPGLVSWADEERDLTAWLGNTMQRDAHERLYALLPRIKRAAAAGHPEILGTWRALSTSDHVYWMSTKFQTDGDVHEYFSPCENPQEAYVRYVNALDHLDRTATEILGSARSNSQS